MRKLQIAVTFLIFLLLSCSFPAKQLRHEAPLSKRSDLKKDKKAIAAQVLLFESVTYDGLEEELAAMKRSGVNIVIVRVFQNKGDRLHPFERRNNNFAQGISHDNGNTLSDKQKTGVYFRSNIAPVVDDVLTRVIEIGHKQGIKVFAWMTTRRMDWKWFDNPKWRDISYELKTGDFVYSKGLDIFNKDVQDYLISLYREIAASGVDGILIQDDLVYRHTEGYSEYARLAYQDTFGFALKPENLYHGVYEVNGKFYVKKYTSLFWKWAEWKNQHITLLLDNIIRETKKISPEIKIALNLYYETIINPKNGIAWFAQDISSLKDISIDYYAVMAYHRQIMKEKNLDLNDALEMISDITQKGLSMINDKEKLLMKVQTVDWDTREAVPLNELNSVFNAIKRGGGVSLAYVQNGNRIPSKIFLDKM